MIQRYLAAAGVLCASLLLGDARAQAPKSPQPHAMPVIQKSKAKHAMKGTSASFDRQQAKTSERDAARQKSGGPPANDNCIGAINLTVGATCVPTIGDVNGATQTIAAITCGPFAGNADNDVWYKFTATAATATIDVTGSTDFDAVVDLRSGTCNGTNIACADATVEGETETINATGLTVGVVYYIRVYDYYVNLPLSTTFEICVYGGVPAPANNECATAEMLTMGTTCSPTSGTTAAATQSIAAITCATFLGDANDDVWYAFVATAADATIEVSGSSGFDAVVDLRSGACTGTNMACADTTIEGGLEMINATGLSIGSTYYVRVYHYATAAPTTSTFDICVYNTAPAPANDDCADVVADALAIGAAIAFNGDNTGATSVNEGPFSAFPTVWHAFTLSACADVTVAYCGTTPAFGNVWVSLSTDCPSTSFVDASAFNNTDCVDGNYTAYYEDLPAGTYWLPVLQDGSASGPYTIEVSAVDCAGSSVVNDLCGPVTPASLAVPGAVNFSGDNTNSTSAGDVVPGTTLDVGGDTTIVWHAFTITTCADISVAYCGTSPLPDVYWAVLSLNCPADNDLILFTGGNFTDCVDGNATIEFANVPAGTYYLPVRGEPASWGPYSIEVTTIACTAPPVNDPCIGAFNLAVNTTCVPTLGSSQNATESLPGINCAGAGLGNANDDVWYTFVATGVSHTVSVIGSASYDAVVEVFSGDCVGLASIACSDTSLDGGTESIEVMGLTIGNTYYVRVYHWYTLAASDPTFTICVTGDIGTAVNSIAGSGPWSIRPNPSNGDLSVGYTGPAGVFTLELIDMTGRVVHRQQVAMVTGQNVDLLLAGRLARGSYSLRTTGAEAQAIQRVVIR